MSYKFKISGPGVSMSDNWPSEQKLTVWSDDSKGTLLFEGDLANEDGTQVPLVWTMTGVNSITAGMYFKLEDQYDDGMLDPDGQAVQFAILDASDVEQFQATLAVGSDELDYLDENDLNSDYLEMKVNASADGFEYIQVPSAPPAVVRTRIHHDQLRMPSHDEYDAELAGEFATPALAVAGGATPGSLSVDGLPLEYIGIGLGLSAYGARGFGVGEMIVNKGKLDEDITEMEGLISDELTRALAAEAGIQAALDAQEAKEAAYEVSNDAALAAEIARASAAEVGIQAALDAQEAKEAAYEVSNDAAVGVERSRIDTLLSGSDVDLDQLVELVAAYELADTSIISSITNLQLSTDAAMATEQAARAAGDAAERAFALAARDANEAARTSEIAAAKVVHDQEIVDAKVVADAAMATEQAARAAGDAGLQAALDAQEAKEAAYEVSNDAALAAEIARASAAEVGIQAALDAQEAKEAAYEVSNDAALAAEIARASAAEVGIQAALDAQEAKEAAYEVSNDAALAALQLDVDANELDGDTDRALIRTEMAASLAFLQADVDANELDGDTDRALIRTEIAAAKVVHDQEIVDAKVVADAAMATEQAARAAGDAGLQAALDAQEAKEAAYEVSNDAALAAEIARAIGSESDLDDAISAEGVRALAAESVLQGNIDVVVGDLASYESANDAAVLVERLRIDDILSNVDPAALDSLTEIVTEMQSISGSLSDSIISALGTHTSELSAHEAVYDAKMLLLDAEDASIRVAFAAGDAAERAFALAARNALQADVDANELDGDTDRALIRTEMAAFEAARDASVEVIRAALQADVDGNESDGDTDRALIRTEMATNESNRDASIAADKATHDAEIAAAKVVADAEMVTEQAARTAGDAAERAFALAARDANESARDASIAADKATHDAEIAAAKVLADAEITNIKADLVSLGGMFQGFTFLPMQMDISAGTQIDFTDPAGLNMPPMSMFTYITLNGMIMNQNTDYTVDYDGSGDIKGFTVNVDLFTGDVVSFFGTKSFDLQS